MKSLRDYKVILWDFDGVILDSMPIRELGFREVLKKYPHNQVEALIQFHKQNGGLSRYVKFRYFFKSILNENVTEEKLLDISNSFSNIMREKLIDKKYLIFESLYFISENFEQISMHIVSGSDQEELRYLCEKLGINFYFKSINGSPRAKDLLVKDIVQNFNYSLSDIVLIGDSENDLDAANLNLIDFAGFNNNTLNGKGKFYIKSFS